jgi:hypothetical protein
MTKPKKKPEPPICVCIRCGKCFRAGDLECGARINGEPWCDPAKVEALVEAAK